MVCPGAGVMFAGFVAVQVDAGQHAIFAIVPEQEQAIVAAAEMRLASRAADELFGRIVGQ